jgi:hypothetical protein
MTGLGANNEQSADLRRTTHPSLNYSSDSTAAPMAELQDFDALPSKV